MGLLDEAIREHLDLKRRRGADPTEIERAERDALGPVRREPSMSAAYVDEGASTAAPDAPVDDFDFVAEVEGFAGEFPTTVMSPEDESAPAIAAPDYADPASREFPVVEPPNVSGLELEPLVPGGLEPDPVSEPVPGLEAKPKRRHLFGRHRHDEDERPLGRRELPVDDAFPEDDRRDAEPVAISDDEAVGRAQAVENDEPLPPAVPPPTLRITPDPEPGNTVEYDVEQAFLDEDGTRPAAGDDILEETPDFLADTPDHDRLWFEQKPPPDFDFDH